MEERGLRIWGLPVRLDATLRPGEWRLGYERPQTLSEALEEAKKAHSQAGRLRED
jgi:hypothetical protein